MPSPAVVNPPRKPVFGRLEAGDPIDVASAFAGMGELAGAVAGGVTDTGPATAPRDDAWTSGTRTVPSGPIRTSFAVPGVFATGTPIFAAAATASPNVAGCVGSMGGLEETAGVPAGGVEVADGPAGPDPPVSSECRASSVIPAGGSIGALAGAVLAGAPDHAEEDGEAESRHGFGPGAPEVPDGVGETPVISACRSSSDMPDEADGAEDAEGADRVGGGVSGGGIVSEAVPVSALATW